MTPPQVWVDKIADSCPLFGRRVYLDDALDNYPAKGMDLPALFVGLDSMPRSENQVLGGSVAQEASEVWHLKIVLANNGPGLTGQNGLYQLRRELTQTLRGWRPTADSAPVDFGGAWRDKDNARPGELRWVEPAITSYSEET